MVRGSTEQLPKPPNDALVVAQHAILTDSVMVPTLSLLQYLNDQHPPSEASHVANLKHGSIRGIKRGSAKVSRMFLFLSMFSS
jgi:hypothetical protein